jgi:hypothetical protein
MLLVTSKIVLNNATPNIPSEIMIVLAPLLSGKENNDEYIEAISKGADKVIVLQVIDKEFMNKTSAAMGEVMQFSTLLSEIKQKIGQKRKKCDEITEWGSTIKKILGVAILQQVDKVVFVEQDNEFFKEILAELKKNKVKYELVKIEEE